MIFVTVGTHEQQFNRLVKFVDELKKNKFIDEEIVIQTGYSTYIPKYCKWQKLYSYGQMAEFMDKARIIITHGGPSSFLAALQIGKIPVVVPRIHEFGEHINNHQVDFTKFVENRNHNIILVKDIEKLKDIIICYDDIVTGMSGKINSNNANFCEGISSLVDSMGL